MNIEELYNKTHCPLCSNSLESYSHSLDFSTLKCPNRHYTNNINYIRLIFNIKPSLDLMCTLDNTGFIIYYRDMNNIISAHETMKTFNRDISHNIINNSKNINQLQNKLIKLYNSLLY